MTAPQEPDSSLVVRRDTTASRQQVWQVVADGWTYSQWVVVGNSRMRAVEPNWPALGTKIHHTIGVWPATIDDETVVEACKPLEELVLLAKGMAVWRCSDNAAAVRHRHWMSHRDDRGTGQGPAQVVPTAAGVTLLRSSGCTDQTS